MTAQGEKPYLVTRDNQKIALLAQGWNALTEN
jgi:hypothetical protein